MGWTDERVESLKRLWQDGLSASQIAKQLGGVSRNAVISKVHRLGLSNRPSASKPARPAYKAPRPARPPAERPTQHRVDAAPKPPPPPPPPPVSYVEEGPGLATVLTLDAHMCKWPIGDPRKATFTYCGRRRNEGPYCIEHARVAYQPIVKNGKRRPTGNELARSLRRFV